MVPTISEKFTNSRGIQYNQVREIAYTKENIMGNLGIFVAETTHENNLFIGNSPTIGSGVYIYQTKQDPNIAYRIYKQFADYGFNGYHDDKLIQSLRERQEKIQLSKFPTGVVTLNGKIIGQEIPYFPNKITLYSLFLKYRDEISPIIFYRAVLDILKEMYDNGIIYLDNHPKNFMAEPGVDLSTIEVIDFDEQYVKFDDYSEKLRAQLFNNYKISVDTLNKICGVKEILGEFIPTTSFENAYEQLQIMEKKLIK